MRGSIDFYRERGGRMVKHYRWRRSMV
ncbi:hypothetical protein Godav_018205, partial [Gossypium davidsonii]|nr:hypothetical protein [Gossypium davidsonii]